VFLHVYVPYVNATCGYYTCNLIGLGGTDKNDHLVGNVPVKLQNINPNKGVPSTLQFVPYDNTLVAGERHIMRKG